MRLYNLRLLFKEFEKKVGKQKFDWKNNEKFQKNLSHLKRKNKVIDFPQVFGPLGQAFFPFRKPC